MYNKSMLVIKGKTPVYSSDSTNNGIIGYTTDEPDFIIDNKNNPFYIIFGDHTRTFNIATKSFSVADNVKVLSMKKHTTINTLLFIVSSWKKNIPNLGYSRHWSIAKNVLFNLPTKNGAIDFDFMESFIAELEQERMQTLQAYLQATGLDNYELTKEEEKAIADYEKLEFASFNLEKLFGKTKRGKRLKSNDRIPGDLPFITAGEANEGFSAYVGNDIEVFNKNTVTIDMFGSAKYRNYEYGADDHVSVINTTAINKFAAIFTTSAIHKTSYNGQFNYGRNFYAKDADIMNITLPTKSNQPDYKTMELIISAIQKLVIKDVVQYADKKIASTKAITNN